MKKTFLWLVILCFTSVSTYAEDAFLHSPTSPAEKALEKIHKEQEHHRNGVPKSITKHLQQSLLEAEKKERQENCGGTYKDGEICGLEIDPISCGIYGNDSWPEQKWTYNYKTVTTNDKKTIIAFVATLSYTSTNGTLIEKRIPEKGTKPYLYRLIKKRGAWLLDGIYCDSNYHFNMSHP